MGLSAGHVNAFDYCTTMMGYPTHAELLEGFLKEEGVKHRITIDQAKEDAALHY